jgi:hypothetical protein
MPEENKIKHDEPMVDIDTSGPETEVDLPEEVVNKVEPENTEQETVVEEVKEVKEEPVKTESGKQDEELEVYSKGVQSRIAKLTRKMREAERREAAAVEYAQAVEQKRQIDNERFQKVDSDYTKKFEENVKTGMDSAQKELAMAIEAGDATAQVEANKRIATLAFENAKLEQRKEQQPVRQEPVRLQDGGNLRQPTPQDLPAPDPQAEEWASRNKWFGQDRAMTFTAFEVHKDLVAEGFDPQSSEYYAEVDKRIKVDFPHKFGNTENIATAKPVQSVASANRSVKSGRKTVRLTSSQVAIAKKLGVPLEDYAKQLKLTEGA